MFRTIVIDPPWETDAGGGGRGAQEHYPLVPFREMRHVIQRARVWQPDLNCCSVWMWATIGALKSGQALALLEQLGAEWVSMRTWVKADPANPAKLCLGLGQRFRWCTEFLMLGVIGHVPVPAPEDRLPSALYALPGAHSEKPQQAYDDIIRHDGPGERAEMFARQARPGWTVWGNEVTACPA